MSKIVCIPGSTTFRPVDDIISIDIHVRMIESVEILPPNDGLSEFMLGAKTQIKTFVVTKFADDKKASPDADDDDDEKSYSTVTKSFEIDSIDIDDVRGEGEITLLTESDTYKALSDNTRSQIDVRIEKYKEYLTYEEARVQLGDKLDNISPATVEPTASEIVEEEDAPLEARGSRILENLNPDRQKLEEIIQWLAENEEKQSKRLPYMENKFKRSTVILEDVDGFGFIDKLAGLSYGVDLIEQVRQIVHRSVDSVSDIIR